MPQEISVVKCYNCNVFQTQIVKKAKKWTCVLCNEKQSLKKTFMVGSGKDCRLQVQKLNEMRGTVDECQEAESEPDEDENEDRDMKEVRMEEVEPRTSCQDTNKISKWSKYLDDDKEDSVES